MSGGSGPSVAGGTVVPALVGEIGAVAMMAGSVKTAAVADNLSAVITPELMKTRLRRTLHGSKASLDLTPGVWLAWPVASFADHDSCQCL